VADTVSGDGVDAVDGDVAGQDEAAVGREEGGLEESRARQDDDYAFQSFSLIVYWRAFSNTLDMRPFLAFDGQMWLEGSRRGG
jgi:hypothetical protein